MTETPRRDMGPERFDPPEKNEQDLEAERHALRELIDRLGDRLEAEDDRRFYRSAGRYIARPMMKPRWPGDQGY